MGLEGFLRDVEKELGDGVSIKPEDLAKYSRDWWPLALLLDKIGMWGIRPKAVVFPKSVDDVSLVVRLANRHSVCLVPYGGGSSVTGSVVSSDCVVLSLGRLNKILSFSEEDLTVTVEAGIILSDLEKWLLEKGYTLRYYPQSMHLATVGGSIATMGASQYSTGYGNIEDIVINIEVVLPTGEVMWAREPLAPRSSMGPDLKSLFIGSEGLLGIITKAVLKIFRKPPFTARGAFGVSNFGSGLRAVRELLTSRITPDIARLYDDAESSFRFGGDKPVLLLCYEGFDEDLVETIWNKARAKIESIGGTFLGEDLYLRWEESRYRYRDEIELLEKANMWFETIDVAATWSKLLKVYEEVKKAIDREDSMILAHASHFYLNGAALYFTLLYPREPGLYWVLIDRVLRAAIEAGATISHHHGVGALRSKWLRADPGASYTIIERVKKALDPNNIMRSLKPIDLSQHVGGSV